MDNHPYALVTGGSEGIGRSIAEALALRGYGLLIVALPDEHLELCRLKLEGCSSFPVHRLGIDLSRDGADLEVYRWVESLGITVSVLVNNAGFGHLGGFSHFSRDFYHRLLQVNLLNVVGITRLLMPHLSSSANGYILNIGSIASFFPMPYKTVYASSKYFIYSFSRGLREEMRGGNIHVSILCPGPVSTNPEVMHRIACAGFFGRLTSLSPEYVGTLAVKRLLKGRWLILPGLPAKLFYLIEKFVPSGIKVRFLARQFRKGSDQA
jgi:uncharacterized protein